MGFFYFTTTADTFIASGSTATKGSVNTCSFSIPSVQVTPITVAVSPLFASIYVPPRIPVLAGMSTPRLCDSSVTVSTSNPPVPISIALAFAPSGIPICIVGSLLSTVEAKLSECYTVLARLFKSPNVVACLPASPFTA